MVTITRLLVLLLGLNLPVAAQDNRDAPPSSDTAVVEPATRFLHTWLVDRDVDSAAASFAAAAFTHGELLAQDCLGLKSINQMGMVREFLGAMNARPARILSDALSTDAGMPLDAPFPALNDVRRDGFGIYRVAKVSLPPDELPGPALNALLPPVFYVQVVPLRESFVVFFIWIPDDGRYRILTVDVQCQ